MAETEHSISVIGDVLHDATIDLRSVSLVAGKLQLDGSLDRPMGVRVFRYGFRLQVPNVCAVAIDDPEHLDDLMIAEVIHGPEGITLVGGSLGSMTMQGRSATFTLVVEDNPLAVRRWGRWKSVR